MLGKIQDKDGRLYIVTGGAWYATPHKTAPFVKVHGEVIGETVTDDTGIDAVWKSLDGVRRYALMSAKPEFTDEIKAEAAKVEAIRATEERLETRSLGQLLDASTDGDVLVIEAGTYEMPSTITLPDGAKIKGETKKLTVTEKPKKPRKPKSKK